ncbi:hypothetical protein EYF80_002585 [Liparis tanakae]|uniref:Uncharacterized protein n=1 Tax=Liparis tanakae TaxID=230148 RepID=A0A4Z2JC37_9TELE|nr:hypothetical protein EYF80_002585 [Liparis tanakae]
MKHRLLYNQRSRPLVVSREKAALTHTQTPIQPEESPPGGQERECSFNTWSIDFYTTGGGYLGGGAAYGHGPVHQTGPHRLVDVPVTRRGAGAQTTQDLLQTRHDLIAALRLRSKGGA